MNLVVLMPVRGRAKLAALSLGHLEQWGLRSVVLTDEDDRGTQDELLRWGPVEIEGQLLLGGKLNEGLRVAWELWRPDAVMTLGSDDFLSPAYVAWIASVLSAEGLGRADEWILGCGVAFWDAATSTAYEYCGPWNGGAKQGDGPPGAGRVYSAALLDACGWSLWQGSAACGMDAQAWAATQRRRELGAVVRAMDGPGVLDVKGFGNMWPMGRLRLLPGRLEARVRTWADDRWPGLVGQIEALAVRECVLRG